MKNNTTFLMGMLAFLFIILTACGNAAEDSDAESNHMSSDNDVMQNENDNLSGHESTQDSSHINPETETDFFEDWGGKGQDESVEGQSQEEPLEEYVPNEDDVVYSNNELKNKDILEAFMETAGENGQDNESEIRVVKDEGTQGVLIYDLKSGYEKSVDQAWIMVYSDLSHYRASEDEVQDVFNTDQQCGYMSKDEIEGNYKLHECRTHWEYRLLPTVDDNEVE
ncbi:hypothetical protein [Oceanobacillus jeddahense]|uniref:hypothetical protein n=1 Tax=Oceanobacillus jeddahense TaxID=1462527 RepID=UPI0005958887|nr:hypothetical protein [Oceanobacillus jeddahense]